MIEMWIYFCNTCKKHFGIEGNIEADHFGTVCPICEGGGNVEDCSDIPIDIELHCIHK